VRRLGLVAVLAATVAASCGGGANSVIHCAVRGEWPRTADAAWVAKVIATAGYKRTDCTGSAFVIDTGGRGRSGHDLYVWTTRSQSVPDYASPGTRSAGVDIQYDRIRAVWRGGSRNVWVEAGPTTRRLLPLKRIRKLVRASVTVD
jgi:hypothetical protein